MKIKGGDTIIFDCPYEENRVGVVTGDNKDNSYEVLSRKIKFTVKIEKIKSVENNECFNSKNM